MNSEDRAMKDLPVIGGPLDGAMTNYKGVVLEAYIPPIGSSPSWPMDVRPDSVIRTQYEKRVIGQNWGCMELSGEAWVWCDYKGDPLVAVMSRLIAQNMSPADRRAGLEVRGE